MRLSSAAFSLACLHVTPATIGGRPPVVLRFPAFSKSILPGAHRRFVGIVARKKSTMSFSDASRGGSGRPPTDIIVIGTMVFGFFGFYFALASKLHRELDRVETKIITMLESKLDGQDRKLTGQDCKLAGQDRKVDGIGQIVALLPLKFELKKYWSWFGRSTSSVESEDRSLDDVVSKVIEKLDAIVDTKITDKLDSMVDAVVDAKLDAKLKELGVTRGQDCVNDTNSSKN